MRGKEGGVVFAGILLTWLALFWGGAEAGALSVNARSAILLNASNGKVLVEQNADQAIAPASVTKILTMYLVYEAIESGRVHLRDRVKISKRAAGTGGSRMFLRSGTTVPLEDLIKGMAVASGNDACVAVAEHLGGSVGEFVREMNIKAKSLGMTSSVFKNPHGLPARGQVTTARDMARLSLAYIRRFPQTLRIHSLRSYTFNKITQRNRNRLLGKCAGVDGIKTGYVAASGYNLSATAKRGNTRLLAVVLGASNPTLRTTETRKLLEEGFSMMASSDPKIVNASAVEKKAGTQKASAKKTSATSGKKSSSRPTPAKHSDPKKQKSTANKSSTSATAGKKAAM